MFLIKVSIYYSTDGVTHKVLTICHMCHIVNIVCFGWRNIRTPWMRNPALGLLKRLVDGMGVSLKPEFAPEKPAKVRM